jgi:AAA family ATP:ADP antiporter
MMMLLSGRDKLFVLSAMLCGFFISADYAIVRPVSNSLFLSHFSGDMLPYVWLLGLPFNLICVALYNRYLTRVGVWGMFLTIVSVVACSNVVAYFLIGGSSTASLVHFIWKELYVLMLFQALWSVIHSTISKEQARFFYGIMFGVGGLGSVLGSLVPGLFAVQLGSEPLLLFSVLTCAVITLSYAYMLKFTAFAKEDPQEKDSTSFKATLALFGEHRLLIFILALILLMQVSATLMDFQFNQFLQATYIEKNIRTEFLGRFGSIVSSATLVLQFIGVMVLIRWLGLLGTHALVPITFAAGACATLLFPGIGTYTTTFGMVKVLDYAVFQVAKENLYVSLPVKAKFHAKAFIDVFAFRASKAFAAFLILGLQFVQLSELRYISIAMLLLCCIWLVALRMLSQRHQTQEQVFPLPL